MQDGVREEDVKLTEVERTLIGMAKVETVLLGHHSGVSFRWYNIVVANYSSVLVQGM